jgi:nucleotide-binding universal stress UspA family protein
VLKKILFPAKFEEFCLNILKSIACLKSAGLEEVVLLHVIDTASLYTEVGWGIIFDLELIEIEANKRLDSYAEYLRGEGITSKTLVCKGHLVSEIIRVATNEDVSLIVAGRQRRGILGELLVGSTTHAIIRKSSVPVLVAKHHTLKEINGEVQDIFCTDMFRKMLYPTDWSSSAERAAEYLRPLQQTGASEVVVVHFIGDWFTETEYTSDEIRILLQKERAEKLSAIEKKLNGWGFKVKTFLLQGGRTYESIIKLASEENVSLIVMGCHGKGFVAETLWGSVSQRVAEYSEKPVLIVK